MSDEKAAIANDFCAYLLVLFAQANEIFNVRYVAVILERVCVREIFGIIGFERIIEFAI